MGCWDAWCPLCGMCFHKPYFTDLNEKDLDKNFIKLCKSNWFSKATILQYNKKPQHNFEEQDCNIGFYKKDGSIAYTIDELKDGIAIHTDCFKFAKNKIDLNYINFDFHKASIQGKKYKFWNHYKFDYLNYKPIDKYHFQDFNTDDLYTNKKDWYVLASPMSTTKAHSELIVKNQKRILKNINIIIKKTPPIRPSPSVAAKVFPIGFKSIGNDGNEYVITKTKNGVLKWIKT